MSYLYDLLSVPQFPSLCKRSLQSWSLGSSIGAYGLFWEPSWKAEWEDVVILIDY